MKTQSQAKFKQHRSQQGMTFIEVLIALVIIVTGILGAVAMQATAKQASFDAMQRSLASSLAEDMVARMRAVPSVNLASYVASDYGGGAYTAAVPGRCNATTAPGCTPTQMITNDQYEWELALMGGDVKLGTENTGGLMNATGCIYQNANRYRVVVSWQGRNDIADAEKDVCGIAGNKRRQVILQAFIF